MLDVLQFSLNGIKKCYYNTAYIFWGFNFEGFLEELERGNIELEFRCGVYKKPEKKRGQMHDRGPAWRLVKSRMSETKK